MCIRDSSKDINKQLEEGMMEYERVSRQVLEDGTYRDPYHVCLLYTSVLCTDF